MPENRLLILDHERSSADFIGSIAVQMGYEILSLECADSFLEKVRAWLPTHIMLDVMMPDIDGLAMLSHLAAENCPAEIILLTGMDHSITTEARQIGLERGLKVIGSLVKPMRVADLHAALDAVQQEVPWLSVSALSQAMKNQECHLHYQPKLDLGSGKIVGLEALMRWEHPSRGAVPPAEFIPFAESSIFIDRLTGWVVDEALAQMRAWLDKGVEIDVSINISSRNLHDRRLAEVLDARCRAHGVAPERITLELTETAAMRDAIQMLDVLGRLRLKGFKLSIDDFGTGYSSLVQLRRLPFSEIKIDRAFIADCTTSTESRSIVRLVIELAHAFGMNAVAEGVERDDELDLLRELGCDQAQGYLIAQPQSADDMEIFLTRHSRLESLKLPSMKKAADSNTTLPFHPMKRRATAQSKSA